MDFLYNIKILSMISKLIKIKSNRKDNREIKFNEFNFDNIKIYDSFSQKTNAKMTERIAKEA